MCQICLSSSSLSYSSSPSASHVSSSSSSSMATWSCKACTFSNTFGWKSCQVCGTRDSFSLTSSLVDLDSIGPSEELDSSVGSVFFPLRACKRKNQEMTTDEPESFREVHTSCDMNSSTRKEDLEMYKILSYNVWFREDLEMCKRMKAIGELIEQHSPDVICFQEITSAIYDIFQQANWWKVYRCSHSKEMADQRAYFCMQLSKLPVKSFKCKPFTDSKLRRELCFTEIDLGENKQLVVATSHLESPSCSPPPKWRNIQMFNKDRVVQANEALIVLKDSPNVIFGGDMNWDDELDGKFPLPDGWVDAWSELRPGEVGYTYDTKSNQMLSGNRTLQKRLDRFVCSLRDFKITEIRMLGLEAIPGLSYFNRGLKLPVLPSDHYGLLLTICNK